MSAYIDYMHLKLDEVMFINFYIRAVVQFN